VHVVREPEVAVIGDLDLELSALQCPIERVVEHGQHDLSPRPAAARRPINVEPTRERRPFAMREHVRPIRILRPDRHVIRDDVDDQPHATFVERAGESIEIVAGAELRIDALRIDDVVAVHAAAPRGEDRREIEMRDAESRVVVEPSMGVTKREAFVHLQPIGRRER